MDFVKIDFFQEPSSTCYILYKINKEYFLASELYHDYYGRVLEHLRKHGRLTVHTVNGNSKIVKRQNMLFINTSSHNNYDLINFLNSNFSETKLQDLEKEYFDKFPEYLI